MELKTLKNIGSEMQRKLNAVGVENAEDLKKMGSKEAFFRLKTKYPEVCLVHLYVLQGAVDGTDYNMLQEDVKADLKKYSDNFK